MNPRDFVYWLQGFLEIQDPKNISEEQITIIKQHMNLVLTNVTNITDVKPYSGLKFDILPGTTC